MKYQTIEAFVQAVQTGEFTGRVTVDNDFVSAYENGNEVCDFNDDTPSGVLIAVLNALGTKAESL